ncbi:MAG: aspartate aminotransferase family protein [Deltaproteobacteria bacterium]|nr:aspartate aminotransferase family protein [Deltaproteobacteria bacterium]
MDHSDSDWVRRSFSVFPGGSLGEFNLTRDLSTVLSHGRGARVYDVYGREFIDFSIGWGSDILGHAHPAVVKAVREQLSRGSNFSYVSRPALELAEEIVRSVPCAEKVRFAASGTEATMYCIRFARAFTGKNGILKFEGAYHGANEYGTMSLFPQRLLDFPQAEPTSAGCSEAIKKEVLVAPFNDLDTTSRIVEKHGESLAAIVVEPLQRCTPPKPGFLEGLRALTRQHGIILVFDEVVTGFRLAYGGAQERYGVIPDICALGKGLGGGYPVGAVCGREDIMDLCTESRLGKDGRYVWFAATLGGNSVTATAGLATLAELRKPGVYEKLYALGEQARKGLREVLSEKGVKGRVLGEGPITQIVFSDEEIVDYRSAFRADRTKARQFSLALFRKGIFLNPMGTKLYISLAHTPQDIDQLVQKARDAL